MQRSHPKVAKFYKSKAWKDCRHSYMSSKNYICERCGQPAVICHHKEYITLNNIDDVNITLDHANLEALCVPCHNKEHFKKEEKEYYFNEEGDLIKI